MDIAGTLVIILGVCGVVGFGNLRTTEGEDDLNLEILKRLWGRAGWIVYFLCLELLSALSFYLSRIIDSVWTERQELETKTFHGDRPSSDETYLQAFNRRRRVFRHTLKKRIEGWSIKKPDIVLRKISGVAWSVSGGLLAGQTLVFAKSAVKLATGEGNQLASPLAIFILLLLAVAAVAQIYCLNKGLEVYDSTLVVPLFFATYTASGFVNSLTYLNQYDNFKDWVFAMVWLSILVLILGVAVLSTKKPEAVKSTTAPEEEDEEQGNVSKETDQYSLATLSRDAPASEVDSDTDEDIDDSKGKGGAFAAAKSRDIPSESVDEFGSFVESAPLASPNER